MNVAGIYVAGSTPPAPNGLGPTGAALTLSLTAIHRGGVDGFLALLSNLLDKTQPSALGVDVLDEVLPGNPLFAAAAASASDRVLDKNTDDKDLKSSNEFKTPLIVTPVYVPAVRIQENQVRPPTQVAGAGSNDALLPIDLSGTRNPNVAPESTPNVSRQFPGAFDPGIDGPRSSGNIAFGLRLTPVTAGSNQDSAPAAPAPAVLPLPADTNNALPDVSKAPEARNNLTSPVEVDSVAADAPAEIVVDHDPTRSAQPQDAAVPAIEDSSEAAELPVESGPVVRVQASRWNSRPAAGVDEHTSQQEQPPSIVPAAAGALEEAPTAAEPDLYPANHPPRPSTSEQPTDPDAPAVTEASAQIGRSTAPTDTNPRPPHRSARTTPTPPRVLPPKVQPQGKPHQRESGASETQTNAPENRPVKKPDETDHRGEAGSKPISGASEGLARHSDVAAPPRASANQPTADPAPTAKVEQQPEINNLIPPQPTRQISLKLGSADSASVDVQLRERAGRVQVAVRTQDHDLAKSLQTDLGDLVGRLENKGFKAESWIPAATHHNAPGAEPGSAGGQNSEQQHSSSWDGQQQQQQHHGGQEPDRRQQPRWMAQLDETVTTENAKENK